MKLFEKALFPSISSDIILYALLSADTYEVLAEYMDPERMLVAAVKTYQFENKDLRLLLAKRLDPKSPPDYIRNFFRVHGSRINEKIGRHWGVEYRLSQVLCPYADRLRRRHGR